MISGIVGSQSTNLPDIAAKTAVEPYNDQKPANRESRVKRFSRLLCKKTISQKIYFMPFASVLIAALDHSPLVLAIDGSAVGTGCTALMIGIVYHKRLLPLAWIVREGKKGHFPEQIHLVLAAAQNCSKSGGFKLLAVLLRKPPVQSKFTDAGGRGIEDDQGSIWSFMGAVKGWGSMSPGTDHRRCH
jgi:hypothetical protein